MDRLYQQVVDMKAAVECVKASPPYALHECMQLSSVGCVVIVIKKKVNTNVCFFFLMSPTQTTAEFGFH